VEQLRALEETVYVDHESRLQKLETAVSMASSNSTSTASSASSQVAAAEQVEEEDYVSRLAQLEQEIYRLKARLAEKGVAVDYEHLAGGPGVESAAVTSSTSGAAAAADSDDGDDASSGFLGALFA
jgi:uncharacterized small protein (DUF1192 family)